MTACKWVLEYPIQAIVTIQLFIASREIQTSDCIYFLALLFEPADV